MYGLKYTTPRSDTSSPYVTNVLRLKHIPPADCIGRYGFMPIKVFKKLSMIRFETLLARKTDLKKLNVHRRSLQLIILIYYGSYLQL